MGTDIIPGALPEHYAEVHADRNNHLVFSCVDTAYTTLRTLMAHTKDTGIPPEAVVPGPMMFSITLQPRADRTGSDPHQPETVVAYLQPEPSPDADYRDIAAITARLSDAATALRHSPAWMFADTYGYALAIREPEPPHEWAIIAVTRHGGTHQLGNLRNLRRPAWDSLRTALFTMMNSAFS